MHQYYDGRKNHMLLLGKNSNSKLIYPLKQDSFSSRSEDLSLFVLIWQKELFIHILNEIGNILINNQIILVQFQMLVFFPFESVQDHFSGMSALIQLYLFFLHFGRKYKYYFI